MVYCIYGCLHPSCVLFVGFGGKMVKIDAFGADLEHNRSNGKKEEHEELEME